MLNGKEKVIFCAAKSLVSRISMRLGTIDHGPSHGSYQRGDRF